MEVHFPPTCRQNLTKWPARSGAGVQSGSPVRSKRVALKGGFRKTRSFLPLSATHPLQALSRMAVTGYDQGE
jgi:hypothetical protein